MSKIIDNIAIKFIDFSCKISIHILVILIRYFYTYNQHLIPIACVVLLFFICLLDNSEYCTAGCEEGQST